MPLSTSVSRLSKSEHTWSDAKEVLNAQPLFFLLDPDQSNSPSSDQVFEEAFEPITAVA